MIAKANVLGAAEFSVICPDRHVDQFFHPLKSRSHPMIECEFQRFSIATLATPVSAQAHLWCRAAEALLFYRPDVVVHLGDHWDMGSLSSYEKAGGLKLEGARIKDDIDAGNEAFVRLFGPMQKEVKRQASRKLKAPWNPECHYLFGNHENRINRAVAGDAKYEGVLTTDALRALLTEDWP
jgi:hypothetical protein